MGDDDATLDRVLAELYGGNPDDFVSRRVAMARELKGQGQADLAREVDKLKRPTASVWAVNRLRETAPDRLGELLDSGRALREAQVGAFQGGEAGDFRALAAAHSAALGRAVEAAAGFLAAQGKPASDVVRQRLQTTLRVASVEGVELEKALAEGRLTADPQPQGFGDFGQLVVMQGTPRAAPSPAGPRPANPKLVALAEAARRSADEQARIARTAQDEAQSLRARAEQLAARAQAADEEAAAAEARAAATAERAQAAADRADTLEREAQP